MTTQRKTALVVFPGRGTYNKAELGYLGRHHSGKAELIATMEAERQRLGQVSLASLDGAHRYDAAVHTRGDNASLLIHACALGDFAEIDRDRFDIAAVTGNSMGWYIALAGAAAVAMPTGARVVNTMGTYMQDALIGGQLVYPFVDEAWHEIPGRRAELLGLASEVTAQGTGYVGLSINLGGMLVFGGDEAGLAGLASRLPADGVFPMALPNHAAFHTALQSPVSDKGLRTFTPGDFLSPETALIDGRGKIWRRGSRDLAGLHAYTFGEQVMQAYDFTRAILVGMREFAPDCVIIPGPGTTLGGAVGQCLVAINWQGLDSKEAFLARQDRDPVILAMGRDDQRRLVSGRHVP